MTDARDFDRLAAAYLADGPTQLADRVLDAALDEVHLTSQRRVTRGVPWRFPIMNGLHVSGWRTNVVAIGLLGLLVIVISMSAAMAGSALFDRAVDPVAPAEPIVWTPARLEQDWPGPLRSEPFLGGPVVQFVPGPESMWDRAAGRWQGLQYDDPVGDVGAEVPWLDIAKVGHGGSGPPVFGLHLAGDLPATVPDPATMWIAYGVVLDTSGDGVPDVRIGMDRSGAGHRAWRTDLATSETAVRVWPRDASSGDFVGVGGILDWYCPGVDSGTPKVAQLYYRARAGEPMPRWYGWASMIEGGRVVATDFAPDVGWLEEPPMPAVTRPQTIVGRTWTLREDIAGSNGPSILRQTFVMTPDGRISIDAGCTQAVGTAFAERGVLRVSDLTVTRLPCSPEVAELDAKFMAFLTAADITYRIEPSFGLLELYSGSDVLQLEPPR
jgi:heat shock protein HslJ